MAIKLGGGGGGGSTIGQAEYRQSSSALTTDNQGQVWLRTGTLTTDVSTYPDAVTDTFLVNDPTTHPRIGNFGMEAYISYVKNLSHVDGYVIGSSSYTSYSRYIQAKIDGSVIGSSNQAIPSDASVMYHGAFCYGKLSGTGSSVFTNANNMFAIGAAYYSTAGTLRLYTYHLQPTTHSRPLALNYVQSAHRNVNVSGYSNYWAAPNTGSGSTNPTYGLHYYPAGRKIIFLDCSSSTAASLVSISPPTSTFGVTDCNINGDVTTDQTPIDYSDGGNRAIIGMSGDDTHIYVQYKNNDSAASDYYDDNWRKIPLNGNLSWASGTDVLSTPIPNENTGVKAHELSGTQLSPVGGTVQSKVPFYKVDSDGEPMFFAGTHYKFYPSKLQQAVGYSTGVTDNGLYSYVRIK